MWIRPLWVASVLFCISSVALSTPEPTRSEYLLSTSASITFEEGVGAYYVMSFDVLKPPADAIYVVVRYENPEDRKAPLSDEVVIAPGANELQLHSAGFKVLRNRAEYRVELSLYADSGHSQLLGTHVQNVEFNVPRDMAAFIAKRYGVRVR